MGILELDDDLGTATLFANIFCYGKAASAAVAMHIETGINMQWNIPDARIYVEKRWYVFLVQINASYRPDLKPEEIFENDDPHNNYFRIENKAAGNISYVDGLGSNTGYFQLDNILPPSTTAAHEFGHTLGLPHPEDLDIRAADVPGIMYPRGTWVQPKFQYDPSVPAGEIGGTMNPIHRVVTQTDIDDLCLEKIEFNKAGQGIVGAFSSVWHEEEG